MAVLCIQPSPYNVLRIRIFHVVDPFKIWNGQLGHPKRYVKKKLLAIVFVRIFPKYGYSKYHRETDFKTLILKSY